MSCFGNRWGYLFAGLLGVLAVRHLPAQQLVKSLRIPWGW